LKASRGGKGRKELDFLTINPAKFLWWTTVTGTKVEAREQRAGSRGDGKE
jgi:hypothetical protein